MENPKDLESYSGHYSEPKFWDKLTKVAKLAGVKVIYASLLLFYVLRSPEVSIADKAKIYGALGYFILPIDFIPDTIPIAGYSDDLAALMWALHSVSKNITPEIKNQAKFKLKSWLDIPAGEELDSFFNI
ncbi:MAG: DUF1232 domain-containing protein [Muribaculaceae bacterium]|jgi:uncharacterized membrane protein YkvA (DUF1232 family)|nr:DUF1232 domain-containing protein [Muribaculaceae bacterium]